MHHLILAGPFTGKTITLRGVNFVNGEARIPGSQEGVKGIINYLGKCYQAYPAGSEQLRKAQEHWAKHLRSKEVVDGRRDLQPEAEQHGDRGVGSQVREEQPRTAEGPADDGAGAVADPSGEAGVDASEGGGLSADQVAEVKNVLRTLAPEDGSHWTAAGLPQVSVVSSRCGFSVTRADITKAWPEFRRPE